VPSLGPAEALRALTQAPEDTVLLDVREPEELDLARVPGALAIPMHELPLRLGEVPRERMVLVLCHHGVRSWHVAQALLAHGWPRVANVSGGIDRWAVEIDPAIGRYG
jgi:rhodanese-related sulfurtransferase